MIKRFILLLVLIIFLILTACSDDLTKNLSDEENNKIEELKKQKEKEYQEAIMKVQENKSTSDLDKRHDLLEKQIDKILEGEKEFVIADFVRIKIELDFLKTQNYDMSKVNTLTKKFIKAYTEAEGLADEEEDYSGQSLNDRYFSLERKIEKISSGETKLEVAEYLRIQEQLDVLLNDGYIEKRINDLQTKLLKFVISQVETAIVDFEPPEEEQSSETASSSATPTESVEPEVIDDVVEEVQGDVTEEVKVVKEIVQEVEEGIIKMIDGGFNKEIVNINVGDTVVFENIRNGRYKIALLFGNNKCREIKSGIFNYGESYNYTFTEPGTCWVSDGIFTTQAMRINVIG